jgi:hypothetical protein
MNSEVEGRGFHDRDLLRGMRRVASAARFALRNAIVGSQAHSGTYLKRALTQLHGKREWCELQRLIVITDEQSHDGILAAWTPRAYAVNVAPSSTASATAMAGRTSTDGRSESSTTSPR